MIDVNPKIGPQSGGTRIYLSGKNLNIGSNVAIYLDDLPCHVERYVDNDFVVEKISNCYLFFTLSETPKHI